MPELVPGPIHHFVALLRSRVVWLQNRQLALHQIKQELVDGVFPHQPDHEMTIWEIANDSIDKASMLVATEDDRTNLNFWDQFGGDGTPLQWTKPPRLQPFAGKKQSKPKPRADISPFRPGSLALNARARDALGDFLEQFGQLLEIDVLGQVEYYCNITNVIDCIDLDRSEVLPGGFIRKPVFKDALIPAQAVVFKAAAHPPSIYVNDAAKTELEKRIADSGITGMSFKKA